VLAIKFADARAFGFACGARNRVTVIDKDENDERIVHVAEQLFGASPLLWQTGGGKYAAAYRFNGERRHVRPIRSLPIDILGGGFIVAPEIIKTCRSVWKYQGGRRRLMHRLKASDELSAWPGGGARDSRILRHPG